MPVRVLSALHSWGRQDPAQIQIQIQIHAGPHGAVRTA